MATFPSCIIVHKFGIGHPSDHWTTHWCRFTWKCSLEQCAWPCMFAGGQVICRRVADQRGRVRDSAVLFSDDSQHSASPVTLRAAFVSSPRYHHSTCPANLAAAADLSPAATGDEVIFDAPALAEETLLDVSPYVTFLFVLMLTHNWCIFSVFYCCAVCYMNVFS